MASGETGQGQEPTQRVGASTGEARSQRPASTEPSATPPVGVVHELLAHLSAVEDWRAEYGIYHAPDCGFIEGLADPMAHHPCTCGAYALRVLLASGYRLYARAVRENERSPEKVDFPPETWRCQCGQYIDGARAALDHYIARDRNDGRCAPVEPTGEDR